MKKINTNEIIKNKIFEQFSIVKTSATKDKFRKDSQKVKFCDIENKFLDWFFAGEGKFEEPLGDQTLRYSEIVKKTSDSLIIKELGGKEKVETTLTEFYDLLKKQANGEKGALLTNGSFNVFYIRDQNGVLRTVRAGWCYNGWFVAARSLRCPYGWAAGLQVFSRN